MAQGAPKKSKPTAPKKPSGPQRGTRVIKPKKASLQSQQKLKKKATSQLTARTEKLLAEKAGHLEVLRGGKREGRIGGGGRNEEKKG